MDGVGCGVRGCGNCEWVGGGVVGKWLCCCGEGVFWGREVCWGDGVVVYGLV